MKLVAKQQVFANDTGRCFTECRHGNLAFLCEADCKNGMTYVSIIGHRCRRRGQRQDGFVPGAERAGPGPAGQAAEGAQPEAAGQALPAGRYFFV